MATTRWWKCDLQVATPAWDFAFPPGSNYDLRSADSAVRQAERIRFLNAYMARLKEQGVELIALADHNTGEWIDDAKAAGERNGVVVFPGCEISVPFFALLPPTWEQSRAGMEHFGLRKPGFSSKIGWKHNRAGRK